MKFAANFIGLHFTKSKVFKIKSRAELVLKRVPKRHAFLFFHLSPDLVLLLPSPPSSCLNGIKLIG